MHPYELKENVKRGELEFPLSLYLVENGSGLILPYHWHDEFEIYHLARGIADVRIGDLTYRLESGDSLLINGGEIHSAVNAGTSDCLYYSIVFNLSMFNSIVTDSSQRLMNDLSISKLFVRHQPPKQECRKKIDLLIEEMIQKLLERPRGYEMYVKGSLYIIFSLLDQNNLIIKNTEKNNRAVNYETIIKKSIDYISSHYQSTIYLDDLANLVQMSKYAFCRCFKQYTGVSPIEYTNIFRINTAYNLLLNSEQNVTDAAMNCGFDNMSYFTKTFKKYKNITPSQVSYHRLKPKDLKP